MAGYELPVTRMDQLGVGTTDYLGRSLAGPGDSHTMSSRSLAGGPGPSLSSPSSLSSSMILSTGKSSRPVSPPMIQVLIFQHCRSSTLYTSYTNKLVPSEASLTKSNLFSLFIGLAIRVLILFYYAQAFYCSGLKRVLSCHVLASLFPRTKSRYINLFVYDYTIIVWDH